MLEKIDIVREALADQKNNLSRNSLSYTEDGNESWLFSWLKTLYYLFIWQQKIEFASVTERSRYGLVIDGPSLNFMLNKTNIGLFIELTQYCSSVLVCRATPSQKSSVVYCVKKKLNSHTLAIGKKALMLHFCVNLQFVYR